MLEEYLFTIVNIFHKIKLKKLISNYRNLELNLQIVCIV
jgi:hypothetical protein